MSDWNRLAIEKTIRDPKALENAGLKCQRISWPAEMYDTYYSVLDKFRSAHAGNVFCTAQFNEVKGDTRCLTGFVFYWE